MRSTLLPRLYSRFHFAGLAAVCAAWLAAAQPATAATVTNADLTAAALAGKAITCTITHGTAPCETSGTFQLFLDSPSAGRYTIAAGTGSTVAHTGTYTLDQYPPDLAFLNLQDYEPGVRVEFELRTSTSFDSVALGGGKVSFGVTRIVGGNGTLGTGTASGAKEGYYEIGAASTTTTPSSLADLSASALAGKTLNFKISSGNAPFESSGSFALVFDSPATGQYTIRGGVSGSVDAHTGAYVYNVGSNEGPHLELKNYFSGGGSAGLDLLFAGSGTANLLTPGNAYFEMSGPGANKHGSFTITSGSGGSGGGGGGTAIPTITTQPLSWIVGLGGNVTFSVTATGTGLTYQWYFNGLALTGEINASLILAAIDALRVGTYTVKITNAGGTVTSEPATLALATASNAGRITNMSVRASAGAGDQTLIVGVIIGGKGTSGKKDVLFRAAGPSLSGLGIAGFLADPKLTAFAGGSAVDSNDNWAGDATILAAAARVGAFAFTGASSKDSALYASPEAGAYSLHVTGGTSGIALAEIYDATATFTDASPRLINVSARAQVGTGDNLLIAGFVIGGSTPRSVLIRALGPKLTSSGVSGVLADPKITVYSRGVKITENDNWSDATNAAAAATATASVGATALTSGSKDAVLLVTLEPGVYSAQVTGVGGTTGVALVELFEAP